MSIDLAVAPVSEGRSGAGVAVVNEEQVNCLVLEHLSLAKSIARRYLSWCSAALDWEDLQQEAVIGLHTAASKWDPSRGVKFSTHATWWIRQAIQTAINKYGRTVRLPAHVCESVNKLRRVRDRLAQELGREPLIDEIAEAADVPVESVRKDLVRSVSVARLDDPIGTGDGHSTFTDFVPGELTPEDFAIEAESRDDLCCMLRNLSEREEKVLRLRFGLGDGYPRTLEEIGRVFDLTHEGIRQIEARALKKLKNAPARPAAVH